MNKIVVFTILSFVLMGCSKSLTKKEKEQFIQQGKEIAQATGENLKRNLIEKMKDGGVKDAVPFCNLKAIPLTDEMAEKFNVIIKRTSHKLRNTVNKANEEENEILKKYADLFDKGKALKPMVEIDDAGYPHFYAPIITQKTCLTCHGEIGNDITKKSDSIIESFYPKDLATGFKEGEIRGIWSITFNN